LLFLLIPVIFVVAYELYTYYLYEIGLISKAFFYPDNNFNNGFNGLNWKRTIIGLSFFGGCFFWMIFSSKLKIIPVHFY